MKQIAVGLLPYTIVFGIVIWVCFVLGTAAPEGLPGQTAAALLSIAGSQAAEEFRLSATGIASWEHLFVSTWRKLAA